VVYRHCLPGQRCCLVKDRPECPAGVEPASAALQAAAWAARPRAHSSGAYGCRSRTSASTGHCAVPLHQCTEQSGWLDSNQRSPASDAGGLPGSPTSTTRKKARCPWTPGLGRLLAMDRVSQPQGMHGQRPGRPTGRLGIEITPATRASTANHHCLIGSGSEPASRSANLVRCTCGDARSGPRFREKTRKPFRSLFHRERSAGQA
jgi:hypothetical protein